MKTFYHLIFLYAFLISCSKKDECIIIEDKYEYNGEYYFYFLDNNLNKPLSQNNSSIDVDPVGSGKVSKEVYDNYKSGDQYCY